MQMKPELSPTQPEFDTDNTPSEYIGIEAPSTDPNESARELFGLDTTPVSKTQHPQQQYYGSDGPLIPMYTPVTPYYGTLYGYPVPMASSSPSPIVGISPPSPFLPPYLPPQCVHYAPNDMAGMIYSVPMVGSQMMYGMGCKVSKLSDGNNVEVDVLESSDVERTVEDSQSTENNRTESFRQKKAPLTPTSHYAHGNGYASKRLRLNECEENITVPPAQLADTEGQKLNVDVIVQDLIRQSRNTNIEVNKDQSAFGGESAVTVHGLSDHEKDQLEQITGSFDLEILLRSGLSSLSTSPNTSTTTNNVQNIQELSHDSMRSSTIPRIHSLLELGNQSIGSMQSAMNGDLPEEMNQSSEMSIESALSTEEIIIEAYQG